MSILQSITPEQPVLSICIPTYNRSALVVPLVKHILQTNGRFELCIHVDGATDDTLSQLHRIHDDRLRITTSENRGRAKSLLRAVTEASGAFIMIFDDDDVLYHSGLNCILTDCTRPLTASVAGFIYQLDAPGQGQLGSAFNIPRSNLIALRADYRVKGDKKEVVRRDLLLPAMQASDGKCRRVPTSLYWSRISLTHDIVTRNEVIGQKRYLDDGMSKRVKLLKRQNPLPLFHLAVVQLRAFYLRRYMSCSFMLLALTKAAYYGVHSFAHIFFAKNHE